MRRTGRNGTPGTVTPYQPSDDSDIRELETALFKMIKNGEFQDTMTEIDEPNQVL